MKKAKKNHILLVEDEIAIQQMVVYILGLEHFTVTPVSEFASMKQQLALFCPDLILLDWMLPNKSGIEIVRYLKDQPNTHNIPVIMLTAKAEEDNKVRGLEVGADDYIIKPFSPRELVARIKAVLRRGVLQNPAGIIKIGPLNLDINRHQLFIDEELVKLAPIEYQLLHFLMKHKEQVFSRIQLLDRIWSTHADVTPRTVDVQIRRLRKALANYQCDHYIKTIRQSGYCFTIESPTQTAI